MRYLALGDSYTIGTGASDGSRSWPSIIAARMGVELTNPAVNGFTTLDLIRHELPYLERSRPDFVSILIGVNDLVQGRTPDQYRESLKVIYDRISALNLMPGSVAVMFPSTPSRLNVLMVPVGSPALVHMSPPVSHSTNVVVTLSGRRSKHVRETLPNNDHDLGYAFARRWFCVVANSAEQH